VTATDALTDLTEQIREFRVAQGKNKPSKAQKRKEKKEALEQKRDEELKEEIKGMKDPRKEENIALAKKLLSLEIPLAVKEIRSDGHCLYRAIADQLILSNYKFSDKNKESYLILREKAAEYMGKNSELFGPFVTNNDGLPLSDEEYKNYVQKITSDKEVVWGGHPEIVALANSLQRNIIVHSALGTPLVVQPQNNTSESKEQNKNKKQTKEKKC